MICDNCLNKITVIGGYHNNQRLCSKCLHEKQPWKKKKCSGDSCENPSIEDLMDKWNRK